MKKYERQNRPWLIGALVSVLAASLFGVALQFFKGEVLDSAIAGQGCGRWGTAWPWRALFWARYCFSTSTDGWGTGSLRAASRP